MKWQARLRGGPICGRDGQAPTVIAKSVVRRPITLSLICATSRAALDLEQQGALTLDTAYRADSC